MLLYNQANQTANYLIFVVPESNDPPNIIKVKKVEGAVASNMRKYIEDTGVQVQLQEVCCNQCGRKIKMENGIVKEGLYHGRVRWEYFSQKDGEYHQFDICEECYDKWVRTFQIPVEKGDYTELV